MEVSISRDIVPALPVLGLLFFAGASGFLLYCMIFFMRYWHKQDYIKLAILLAIFFGSCAGLFFISGGSITL